MRDDLTNFYLMFLNTHTVVSKLDIGSREAKGKEDADSTEDQGFSMSHMDMSVDPMADFFLYTSGNWVRNNPVPKDKSSWNSFLELSESNSIKLREILEECAAADEGKNDGLVKLLGDFYISAMDTETLEKVRFEPVSEFMEKVDGIDSINRLVETVEFLHSRGISPFFQVSSRTDEKKSEVYGLYIDQGGLSLPDRDYYLSDEFREIREKYIEHISRIFSIYGIEKDTSRSMAQTVLSIETDIAGASRSRTELRDAERNYNRLELNQIEGRYQNLMLLRYLDLAGIPKVDYIIAGQPEYLKFLDSMFKSAAIDDLKAYLKWTILNESAPFMFSEVQEEHFDMFGRTILGQKEQEPRWKRVVRALDEYVGEALGELYVRKYFGKEARERMERMVNDIKEVFVERLLKLDWMTGETKKHALEKFNRFRAKVGHPEKFKDYSSVIIRKEDYFGNVCRASSFEFKRHMERVGSPVDKDEWYMTPSTVNAYFSPPDNEIVFPAGILQPPFFDTSVDIAINYGAIGSVISHEITHGYDDQGRRYDENGNIKDWWNEEDEKSFNERADMVKELYGAMEVLPGLKINGELTLGENIADLGGVSIAYEALQRRLSKEPDLRKNIGGFTQEQLFFISFGQLWRQNILDPMAKLLVTVDPHSPNRFRAMLPVYCHPDFKNTFAEKSKLSEPAIGRSIEIW